MRDPFIAAHEATLDTAGDDPIEFDRATWDAARFSAVGLDVEVYRNFFVACFKRFVDGKRLAFERSRRADFDAQEVLRVLRSNLIVTFNGSTYDLPILFYALKGKSCAELKRVSDQIIRSNVRPWDVERIVGFRVPKIDHVDLMEPNPSVRGGLKVLAGRLHARYVIDLPYDPDAELSPREMNVTTLYCQNDLDHNQLLYNALREPLEMRLALGKRYGMDLRSRSDSQVGEAIVRRRIERLTRRPIERPEPSGVRTFLYEAPVFIRFEGTTMTGVLGELRTAVFSANHGDIKPPSFLEDLKVAIGRSAYSMGIGGLHSTEAHRAIRSDDRSVLIDVDVASQYPSIIRNLGLYPEGAGKPFLEVYADLIRERLAAKDAGDKVAAEGLKISVNGVYGKLGSPYSFLYAPHLLIATTLTGQLAILMLIERSEIAGVPVVSANTDGVVFHCPRDREADLDEILATWEADTGLKIEKTRYAALYSSSVNTYVAIREDGKVKRKGPLADPWSDGDLRGQMQKNPQMTVCSEAVIRYLRDGVPIQETIDASTDPRAFVTVIKSTAGATWRSFPLGRTIRYYWSTDGEPIRTRAGGKVAKTDGAKPLIELTDAIPVDVDRLRYCEEAARLLVELGVTGE